MWTRVATTIVVFWAGLGVACGGGKSKKSSGETRATVTVGGKKLEGLRTFAAFTNDWTLAVYAVKGCSGPILCDDPGVSKGLLMFSTISGKTPKCVKERKYGVTFKAAYGVKLGPGKFDTHPTGRPLARINPEIPAVGLLSGIRGHARIKSLSSSRVAISFDFKLDNGQRVTSKSIEAKVCGKKNAATLSAKGKSIAPRWKLPIAKIKAAPPKITARLKELKWEWRFKHRPAQGSRPEAAVWALTRIPTGKVGARLRIEAPDPARYGGAKFRGKTRVQGFPARVGISSAAVELPKLIVNASTSSRRLLSSADAVKLAPLKTLAGL